MSDLEDIPEADRSEFAPHPRMVPRVFGHNEAQSRLAEALSGDRLHHAWLLTGPQGIGKATLAWQVAKALLTDSTPEGPVLPLVGADNPVIRRIEALSEPGLLLLRRPWDEKRKALTSQITVDTVRGLKRFFALSRPDGGRRVVIVDSADDMNTNAANALLKQLEEPPAATVFLLISHRPSRLLPTIRSRCRTLALSPLSTEDVAAALSQALPDLEADATTALAELSGGSPGMAVRLFAHDGPALRRDLLSLFGTMPGADRSAAHRLAQSLAARGSEDRLDLLLQITDELMADLARGAALGRNDTLPPPLQRLAPGPAAARLWADACGVTTDRVRQGLALNLDPHSLLLDMVQRIDRTAQQASPPQ